MSVVAALLYSVMMTGATGVLVRNSARTRAGRAAWLLLSAGVVLLLASQLVLVWTGPSPGALAVDGTSIERHGSLFTASLVAYVLLYAGQMLLLMWRVQGLLPSAWVDGVVAAVLLLAVACAIAGHPGRPGPELGFLTAVALVVRPLLDLLLAAFAVANWALSGWRTDSRLPLLAAAFSVLTLSDAVESLRVVHLVELSGTAAGVGVGRLLVVTLLAVASGLPATHAMVRARSGSAPDMMSPVAVMVGTLTLLAVDRAGVLEIGAAGFALCLLGLLGVGAKCMIMVVEVQRLSLQRHLAGTDDLTLLANRRRLGEVMTSALRDGAPVTLLLMDLNAFKEVNDRYGHAAGDDLLTQVARRTEDVVSPSSDQRVSAASWQDSTSRLEAAPHSQRRHLAARLGGDEFAVLLMHTTESEGLEVANVLAAAVAVPVKVGQHTFNVTASIGVSTAHQHRPVTTSISRATPAATAAAPGRATDPVDAEELLRRADVAMYRSKRAGQPVSAFDATFDDEVRARAHLLEELQEELDAAHRTDRPTARDARSPRVAQMRLGSRLVPYYQPQVDARTGRVDGVEALVRWHHPRLGLLAPYAFLPLAKEHDLIGRITRRMLTLSVTQAASWRQQGHLLRVSVNLSPDCLQDPTLVTFVDELLLATAMPAAALTLELTETSLMSNQAQALRGAQALRARGVGISIDDYGTGYSALSYLKDLPATELKIDRSFINDLRRDERTSAIVAATIEMATTLGLRTVGEGVEDSTTQEILAAMGCSSIQGYLHSPPLPAEDLLRWLDARSAPAAFVPAVS